MIRGATRVFFVDWHGVLCNMPFWHSILLKRSHRLHLPLKGSSEILFRNKKDLVRKWMRGDVGSREIIRELGIEIGNGHKDDFLYRRLYRDCRKMAVDVELLEFLKEFREHNLLVIATDNMDCFFESLSKIHGLLGNFDSVLCSSELGVLKGDGIDVFFGPWLEARGLGFEEAVLIDDSEEICRAFEEAGGKSFLYKNLDDLKSALSAWVHH